MRTIPKRLALKLLEWHGGQGSALYAVGSSGYVGRPVSVELIVKAANELGRSVSGTGVTAVGELLRLQAKLLEIARR